MLYPLKFTPLFYDKIWGGQKIRTRLGMDFSPLPNCGEAWVLSGVHGKNTLVSNGFLQGNELNEVLEIYMDELVGEKSFSAFGPQFPVLVKWIDSGDWLSVQVHPDDELAARRHLGTGKSEMWYIKDADPGARLIAGFNRPLQAAEYLKSLADNKITDILNFEPVAAGDVFFMPAGRVHALGPGILLAEIQQTSDTTYRIYDWDRVDASGKARELHTDLALEAIDFDPVDSVRTRYRENLNRASTLLDDPAFTVNLLPADRPVAKDYSALDSFVIWLATEGSGNVLSPGCEPVALKAGEAVLIPAALEEALLLPQPAIRILEVYIG